MQTTPIKIQRDAFYPLALASDLTGIRIETIRAAIKDDHLKAVKRGNTWFIPGDLLADWLSPSEVSGVDE